MFLTIATLISSANAADGKEFVKINLKDVSSKAV